MTIHLLVALAPIALALLLLAVRVPALWAGTAALVVAVLGGFTLFTPGTATITDTATQMTPTVIVVGLIILGGIGLAEAMARSGGQDAIAGWLARTEPQGDRTLTLLLLVFGLTPLMEAITGFGIGVVITAPLLIRHGLPPVQAITAGLLGLVIVPWGSLAPGTLVAAQLAGQDFHALGTWSALLSLPVLAVSMVIVLIIAAPRLSLRLVGIAVALVALQWAGLVAASLTVGPPLTGVLASTVVIAGLLGLIRATSGPLPRLNRHLVRAMAPYVLLTAGILTTTAILALAGHPAGWGWIASPALWLVLAAATAPIPLQIPRADLPAMAIQVLRRWANAGGTAVVFLLLGIVMATTGTAEYLAHSAAQMGTVFLVAIPAVGALGGYLTGSNTGAAAMFSTATTAAASGLGVSPLVALATQNVAGSYAIIASPPRIALAAAVALPAGQRLPGKATGVLLLAVAVVVVILGAATPLLM